MTSEEHLHTSDILAFRERRLSDQEQSAATRHLLQCAICRGRLPLPTPEEFWRCLLGSDEEASQLTNSSLWISAKVSARGILGQFAFRNAVFAGLLLIAIAGLSWFLRMPVSSAVDENLIAAVANDDSMNFSHPPVPNRAAQDETASIEPPVSSGDSVKTRSETSKRSLSTPGGVRVPTSQRNSRELPPREPQRQAETRGKTPCTLQRFIVFDVRGSEAGLLVKWEKVKDAVKYSLYLSDLDERLIDHFETSDQISYRVKANLDTKTVYRIRLIATLENGDRIVSESRNFTVDELDKGSQSLGNIGVRKKTAASVRCVEVKQ